MATNYDINYNDERFREVESDKKEALSELEQTYAGMINNSDKYYQAQIDASKQWADKQTQIQQQQTDFAIEKIEQQKAQAQKDYTKEQSGAYVDWQKQSNQYGATAEAMAAQGLAGSGYSESSQVSMYNTYQNRVTTAREAYSRAVLNYDNAIKDARLQNNAALAEIAYQALQAQLELSLQGFQYKNQLILAKADKKLQVEDTYYQRYQDVLKQINTENALAEEVRQYNQNHALQVKEYEEGVRQFNAELALSQAKLAEEKRQFNALHSGSGSIKKGSSGGGGSGGSKKTSGTSSQIHNRITSNMGAMADPGKQSSGFTGSTYSEAVAYMKKNGVSGALASSVMTKSEWSRRKGSGSTSAHTANYSSYTAYLKDYSEYAINSSK